MHASVWDLYIVERDEPAPTWISGRWGTQAFQTRIAADLFASEIGCSVIITHWGKDPEGDPVLLGYEERSP
jgi:hypothetical protein